MQPFDRDARLIGYVLEGEPNAQVLTGATYDNYSDLFDFGKTLWDAGTCSKFVIALVAQDDDGNVRMLGHVRPDQSNFTARTGCDFIVGCWAEEPGATLYERHFGGAEWSATAERVFERVYGTSIANVR